MKSSKVLLNLSAFVCYIYGALYIFTLVFIPLGVYCFIAARRFSFKADNIYDTFSLSKKNFRNYVIFASIACFPFGLLSIIPYNILNSNKVKILETKSENLNEASNDEGQQNLNESVSENSSASDAQNVESGETQQDEKHEEVIATEPETMAEKQEKFKKLQSFNEKGLVTDEELEMARVQLFGKDEKK